MLMKKSLKNINLICLYILINLLVINSLPAYEVIINKKVLRFINLQSDYCAYIEHEIIFENVSKQNVSVYKFEIEPGVVYHRFSAYVDNDNELTYYNITHQYKNNKNDYIQINLLKPLRSGEHGKIYVNFIHLLATKQITARANSEYILLLYPGNKYFYSSYNTLVQSTLVHYYEPIHHNSPRYNNDEMGKIEKMYGPYKYIERNTYEPINIEYISYTMIIVQKYEREIDASSIFGKIKITETIELINKGTKIKKFDVDFRKPEVNRRIKWCIPKNSSYLTYYDTLGYVNLDQGISNMTTDLSILSLRLRYPLLGGWKTSITLSYIVPADDYLLFDASTNNFILQMPIIHLGDGRMLILSFLVRIILPSNAEIIATEIFERNQVTNVYKLLKHDSIPALLFMPPRKVVQYVANDILILDKTEFLISYYSSLTIWDVGWNFASLIGVIFLVIVVLRHFIADSDSNDSYFVNKDYHNKKIKF